jgi:YggT family protein
MGIVYNAVDVCFEVYKVILFARIILSFVRHNPYSPIIRFVYDLSEPFLGFFRRFIPPMGMIDFSPIVALFALSVIKWLVLSVVGTIF